MISLKTGLKKIWYMLRTNFWIQYLFMIGIIMELVEIAIGAGSYFFLTKVFPQGTTAVMTEYDTDVVSYIIIGIALNSMLSQGLIGFYNSLVTSYFDRSLERVLISPTSIYSLLFSNMISGQLYGVTYTMLYLVVGVLFFGISLGTGNVVLAILLLLLGVIATTGLGMLFSLFFLYTAWGKGRPNPVIMFAREFASTFSGAIFPVKVLIGYAPWLYPICAFLPQTHALSAVRMVLGGAGLLAPSIMPDIIYLAVFALITVPVGYFLINRGLDRVRKQGYALEGVWVY